MKKRKILAYAWLSSVIGAVTYLAIKDGMLERVATAFAAAIAIGVTVISFIEVLADD